jgi:hypothetical protein
MQVLKTRWLVRWVRRERIADSGLLGAIGALQEVRDDP